MADVEWIRIGDLAGQPDAAELLATALTELAAAQALVMIHGEHAGAKRYIDAGGRVRFDDDGEPVIARTKTVHRG